MTMGLTAVEAWAAGPRPVFQMPVPCGQTWRASTYEAHWNGDQDAIDLAQRDEDQNNLSEGEFAIAAAAGTVSQVYTNGTGGIFLYGGATGSAQVRELNAAGSGSSSIWSASWTTGWR